MCTLPSAMVTPVPKKTLGSTGDVLADDRVMAKTRQFVDQSGSHLPDIAANHGRAFELGFRFGLCQLECGH